MEDEIKVYTAWGTTTVNELEMDVNAAKRKGLSGKMAFTPETVEALLFIIKTQKEELDERQ